MKILGVCGSLQAESSNLTLLRRAVVRAPPGTVVTIFDGIRDLPLFNPDLEGTGTAAAVTLWRDAIRSHDAVLIATPEYGHSLPGALKNAIDWVIGSGELYQKLVAVTASAPGQGRGQRGLNALCTTLRGVNARILEGEPIVRGQSFDAELQLLLQVLTEMQQH